MKQEKPVLVCEIELLEEDDDTSTQASLLVLKCDTSQNRMPAQNQHSTTKLSQHMCLDALLLISSPCATRGMLHVR